MDTLEWGTTERPANSSRWQRRGPRWLGPSLAVYLAGGGAALAVAAEVLPWAGFAQSTSGGLNLDSINTIAVLSYYLCWIALLGLTGLVLTGRPATRRAAAGGALGVGTALVMVLAGIVRWIFARNGLTDPTAPSVSPTDSTASASPSLGPGLFCAVLAVGLVLAAVVVAVRRRGPVVGTASSPRPAAFDAEPVELEVRSVSPLDESVFTRPEISG